MSEKGPEPAWYLIAVAVGWYFLSSIFVGLLFETNHGVVQNLIFAAASLVGLLIVTTIRARKVGQGSIRLGLGDQPVSNRFYVAVLAVMIGVYAVMLETVRHRIYPDSASQLILLNPWQSLLSLSVVVGLAPASEELFFRGWLWTGLRKHWSFVPTATATSALWLAIHLDRPSLSILPVLLVPVAIMLSLARHLGRSVRASIVLHVTYNFTIETWLWALNTVGFLRV